jgi:hypothetical protein
VLSKSLSGAVKIGFSNKQCKNNIMSFPENTSTIMFDMDNGYLWLIPCFFRLNKLSIALNGNRSFKVSNTAG